MNKYRQNSRPSLERMRRPAAATRPLGKKVMLAAPTKPLAKPLLSEPLLLREEIGDVLRSARLEQGRTLREVSSRAKVSLGYLSEVERGQKEASSELLASICKALDLPLSSNSPLML